MTRYTWPAAGQDEGNVAGSRLADQIRGRVGSQIDGYAFNTAKEAALAEMLAGTGETIAVSSYGAVGDGVSDDYLAIQAAIDSATAGSVVVLSAGKNYLVSEELELRRSGVVFCAIGATITGPPGGTTNGTLIAIVDRDNVATVITDSKVVGGKWVPKNAIDNGIGVVSAHYCSIEGVVVDVTDGRRGIAVQTNSTYTNAIPVRFLRVSGVHTYGGGVDGLHIEADGSRIRDIVVEGCLFEDGEQGIAISGVDDTSFVIGCAITNVDIVGATETAMSILRLKDSVISNVTAQDCGYRGIFTRQLNNVQFGNISIRSVASPSGAGTAIGLYTTAGTGANARSTFNGLHIAGGFTTGILLNQHESALDNVLIEDATTGIDTAGFRTVWGQVRFLACTTNIDNLATATDIWQSPPIALDSSAVTPENTPQTLGSGSQVHSGAGVPAGGLGANGDLYFRSDGTAATAIYYKASGSWTAV